MKIAYSRLMGDKPAPVIMEVSQAGPHFLTSRRLNAWLSRLRSTGLEGDPWKGYLRQEALNGMIVTAFTSIASCG